MTPIRQQNPAAQADHAHSDSAANMTIEIATHLMFAGDASTALEFYATVFPEFRVERLQRYAPGEAGPPGTVHRADVVFGRHRLVVIDSPVKHDFTFTPAMSLFVDCDSEAMLDAAFEQLAQGGRVLMPIANYGFGRRFGWCSDRFGVSWQLNLP
jgi:predicted 3-demethylubiquinone-9 3-methyltransferase (glyoxalase superfamily)